MPDRPLQGGEIRTADVGSGSTLDGRRTRITATELSFTEALNGNPKVLYTAIMNGMHNLSPIARQMVAMPIEGDAQGRHGFPTFEWLEA